MAFRGGILLIFPLAIMVIFIMLSASAASSLNGSGPVSFCASGQNCQQTNSGPGLTIYYCSPPASSLKAWCQILPSCITPTPSPAWCFPSPFNLIPGAGGTNLWIGDSVTLNSTQVSQGASGYAFFGFNTNGTLAFIGFISVLIGVATLAGLNIFGTGLQGESIQILTQGALLIGLWVILSGLEGFGNGMDVFAAMNTIYGAGNALYAILTLIYLIGFAGTISRSGV